MPASVGSTESIETLREKLADLRAGKTEAAKLDEEKPAPIVRIGGGPIMRLGMKDARVIALRAGVPERVPAVTLGRNCASGMEAITSAATCILAGRGDALRGGRSALTPLLADLLADPLAD